MCSSSSISISISAGTTTIMENYQVGDLTDILLRATGGGGAPSSHHNQWQQQGHFSPVPVEDRQRGGSSSTATNSIFGDPFSTVRDPFLQELHIPPTCYATSGLDDAAAASTFAAPPPPPPAAVFAQQTSNRTPASNNIFSNMIQISPGNAKLLPPSMTSNSSPRGGAPPAINMLNNANSSSAKDSSSCLLDNSSSLQISSPRNPPLKRRKNQAKKVVCIPAPAAANNRQTGEVVPSDLWAWRKYGQKPIKGSPYPRGYYRCSSSKGCSARKQVERSRTDPNMLVITYTSEHNHPWPTQRNALAGSTRSQPSKNNNSNAASASSKNSDVSQNHQKGITGTTTAAAAATTTTNNNKAKEEEQQESNNNSEGNVSVKEEMEEEMQLEMDDDVDGEFSTYKPSMMMEGNNNQSHHEDFFAELGEIEADPLNLLFSQGFNGGDKRESKALDPFSLFDWSGDTNNSYEEPNSKGRL